MGKSELVPVGVVPNIADMVDGLGCKQGSFPMKYLGLPLGANVKDSFMESNYWEDGEEISRMEMVVSFKRR